VSYPATLYDGLEPFPGYRLYRPLGSGGFGTVWEARNPRGRPLALKFLPCDAQRSTAQEIRALQAVRQLRHPHLIRIDQVWCHLGYIVIAMELADGSLGDLLELCLHDYGTPIPAEQVCFYLGQAAQALDFLNQTQHALNGRRGTIQHCDIKPSNLLLFGENIKVADFGLSSMLGSAMQVHRKAGTLDYCAAEVFQGRLSEHTDQYALAVSYCLLRGGRVPFPDTPATFEPGYVRPEPDLTMLSAAEQAVVARALCPVPMKRWASCGEFISRLTKVVQEQLDGGEVLASLHV